MIVGCCWNKIIISIRIMIVDGRSASSGVGGAVNGRIGETVNHVRSGAKF